MSESPSFTVAAMFENRNAAEAAVADLELTGFDSQSIQLIAHPSVRKVHLPALPVGTSTGTSNNAGGTPGYFPGLGDALFTLKLGEVELGAYHTRIKSGEALVAVAGDERTSIARTILERNGGEILAR